MSKRFVGLLLLGLLLTAPTPTAHAETGAITAHLLALERGRNGGEMRVRFELSWPGRPELHLVSAPSIEVPRDGALRSGLSRSRFDGNTTHWSHDATITLPNRAGPWTIGPARVTVQGRDGEQAEVVAAPIRVGRPSRNGHLLSQALGNGMVLSLVLFFGFWRYRRLQEDEGPDQSAVDSALALAETEAGRAAADNASQAFLEALLQLRLAVDGPDVDNGALWTAEQIQERIDKIRFGGEEIPTAECLQMLVAMKTAANREPGR